MAKKAKKSARKSMRTQSRNNKPTHSARSRSRSRDDDDNYDRPKRRRSRNDDYDNTDRGVLFENRRKKTDSHPDLTGSINIGGVDRWLSAWWNESRNGLEFLSLSIGDEKEELDERDDERPRKKRSRANDNDDLPF